MNLLRKINNRTNNSINNRTNATYGRKNGNGKHQELGVAQKKDVHIAVSEEEIKAAAMQKMQNPDRTLQAIAEDSLLHPPRVFD